MDSSQQRHPTQLLTVRLWQEDLGDGRTVWRGQLQHVLSSETHYFREWLTLLALLQAMLPAETDSASDGQLHPSAW